MALNDQQAINSLLKLYDDLEKSAAISDPLGSVDKESLRKFKAEETVKIFKAYIKSGSVQTTVSGATSDGASVTGTGQGSIS